jgi:hypothetical protein
VLIAIERFAVVVPPEFVADTVYAAEFWPVVGVPVIAQAFESESPAGSAGETEQEVTVPPLFVGVIVPIELPAFQE